MWDVSEKSPPRRRRGSISDRSHDDSKSRRSSILPPVDVPSLSHRSSMFEASSRRPSVYSEAALKRHGSTGHDIDLSSRRSSTVSILSVTSDVSRRSSNASSISTTPPNSRPTSMTRRASRAKLGGGSKKNKVFFMLLTNPFFVCKFYLMHDIF